MLPKKIRNSILTFFLKKVNFCCTIFFLTKQEVPRAFWIADESKLGGTTRQLSSEVYVFYVEFIAHFKFNFKISHLEHFLRIPIYDSKNRSFESSSSLDLSIVFSSLDFQVQFLF